MNRTLLLIICDFLLISILALIRLDSTEIENPREAREQRHAEGVQEDMLELLRLSLEDEAMRREQLAQTLAEREATLDETERDREMTAEELAREREERERLRQEFEQTQQTLELTVEERERLAEESERLAAERSRIASDLDAQRAQARQLQAELQARQAELARAEQTLTEAEERAREMERLRNQLETDLQITRTERSMLEQNLTAARAEVETARVERQRAEQRAEQLASNVGALAERSTAIEEEIRRAQPISLNQIFSRYEANRLPLQFTARVDALFGSRSESAQIDAILVRSGGRTFALFESGLTPLRLENLSRVRSVEARFGAGGQQYEIVEISLLQADPRIMAVQIPERIVEASGLTPFEITTEPLRFPEVVLVSNRLGEFGETSFRLIPGGQRYLSVPNRLLGRVFGSDFGASRGDYIFAKTGDLMGVMLSSDRGAILSDLASVAELRIGDDFSQESATRLQQTLTPGLPGIEPPTTPPSPRR